MLVDLGNAISQSFNMDELRGLCIDLDIEFENVNGSTRELKAKELVLYCHRRGDLQKLVNRCMELRPKKDWSKYANFDFSDQSIKSSTQNSLHIQSISEVDDTGIQPEHGVETGASMSIYQSSIFFYERFRKAFPGVRGTEWIKDPTDAIERLKILLSEPIYFGNSRPIWWWRSGDMHIESFQVLSHDTVLLDKYELIIDELAAVNEDQYYQVFVYLKTKASAPTGLYPNPRIKDQINNHGYAYENYALFQGRPIRIEEWEDGATIIEGKIVDLGNEAEVRTRYLTPYNLIIAPQGSPVNSSKFDSRREEIFNAILKNEVTVEDLTREILELPRIRWPNSWDRYS